MSIVDGRDIIIINCLALNAVLAAYEIAFVSFPKRELLKAAKQGSKNAEHILRWRDDPERTLSLIQIGITLGALAAAVGSAAAVKIIEPYFIKIGLRLSPCGKPLKLRCEVLLGC